MPKYVILFLWMLAIQIGASATPAHTQELALADEDRFARLAEDNLKTNKAILEGLKWLSSQQRMDGSWTFTSGPDAGTLDAPIAATSMALLAFLQSGHSPTKGAYKENVLKGVDYLVRHVNVGRNGADMGEMGAEMYGHGLAAIALCEAYSRSSDPILRAPAQQVVDFIIYAQDPTGGGWRYQPRQPGDTSVFGWQMTALIAAKRGELIVPEQTFQNAGRFLDSVQSDDGSAFGYTTSGAGICTTSVGLLGRLYLGAKSESSAIERGIAKSLVHGPREDDVYFNYFTTRLMREAGGNSREAWNQALRKVLLETQEEDGSWSYKDNLFSQRAGRIGVTSMCINALAITNE
ncbi:prenyltransferase/squalene oxidase repeat-containing protein [Lignipirellula cremea]|uniref:Prenyltransferase and squalene oxidase repeat protein n=1 Tax=Lignipirellula cremea TaxID=2528010 RepID=A0A518DQG3_9BACT|nr:prenyltransferase/squalene oxidase repeat-containing protein [Lignipirellula cremea]QDU94076.1 hypothetical protein Pla8534_18620 [Lignipirellula cremea]